VTLTFHLLIFDLHQPLFISIRVTSPKKNINFLRRSNIDWTKVCEVCDRETEKYQKYEAYPLVTVFDAMMHGSKIIFVLIWRKNRSTVNKDVCEKQYLHFRSQWPRICSPVTLVPSYVSTKFIHSSLFAQKFQYNTTKSKGTELDGRKGR